MPPPAQQGHGRQGLLVSGADASGPAAGAGTLRQRRGHHRRWLRRIDPGGLQGLLTESRIGSTLPLQALRWMTLCDMTAPVANVGGA